MAYAYCISCNAKMDEPTLEEVVNQEWLCKACGRGHTLRKSLGDCVLELAERVAELEAKLSSSK